MEKTVVKNNYVEELVKLIRSDLVKKNYLNKYLIIMKMISQMHSKNYQKTKEKNYIRF